MKLKCCTTTGSTGRNLTDPVFYDIIHENCLDCIVQTRAMLQQRLSDVANAFVTRCRAYYKVAMLPLELEKFMFKIHEAHSMSRRCIVDCLPGWTIQKRVRTFGVYVSGAVYKHDDTSWCNDCIIRLSQHCFMV